MTRIVVKTASKNNLQKRSRNQLLARLGVLFSKKRQLKKRLQSKSFQGKGADLTRIRQQIARADREINKTNDVLKTKR